MRRFDGYGMIIHYNNIRGTKGLHECRARKVNNFYIKEHLLVVLWRHTENYISIILKSSYNSLPFIDYCKSP